MSVFPYLVVAWVLAVGLYGIITSRHLVHQIISLIVVQSSTYVLCWPLAFEPTRSLPTSTTSASAPAPSIPWCQALALTDVVVEAAVTALLLALAIQAHKRFGTLDPQELVQFKG